MLLLSSRARCASSMLLLLLSVPIWTFLVFCPSAVVVAAGPLTDDHPSCADWAAAGECEKNPDYMLVNCKKSCHDEDTEALSKINSFYDFQIWDIDGKLVNFKQFQGKVVILTNVASYCGYTESHYRGLVELWSQVKDEAVEILAFPCNQFGQQEPGSAAEIKSFAEQKGVQFRMMQKVDVNGPKAHLLYKYLKAQAGPARIHWNFATYFVVSPDGQVTSHSGVEPMSLKTLALGLLEKTEL